MTDHANQSAAECIEILDRLEAAAADGGFNMFPVNKDQMSFKLSMKE